MRPIVTVMPGERFGRLAVLKEIEPFGNSRMVLCRCDCGNDKAIRLSSLTLGRTRSCGCLLKETRPTRTHGMSKRNRTYCSWASMKTRCRNQNAKSYAEYGAKGVLICDRWLHSFENFLHDMGERPAGMTIDRINNGLGYEPSNCRWATNKEQGFNKPSSRIYEYNGERRTLNDWATQKGVSRAFLRDRLNGGWTFEEAIERPRLTPKQRGKSNPRKIDSEIYHDCPVEGDQ